MPHVNLCMVENRPARKSSSRSKFNDITLIKNHFPIPKQVQTTHSPLTDLSTTPTHLINTNSIHTLLIIFSISNPLSFLSPPSQTQTDLTTQLQLPQHPLPSPSSSLSFSSSTPNQDQEITLYNSTEPNQNSNFPNPSPLSDLTPASGHDCCCCHACWPPFL